MSTKRFLYIVCGIGIMVRLCIMGVGFWVGGPAYYLNYSDAIGYLNIAKNIIAGQGVSFDIAPPFIPTAHRTPGYPVFLTTSLFLSGGVGIALGVQIILGALLPLVSYWLIKRLYFDDRVAWGTALVLALEPFFAAHSAFLLTEVLFISIFLIICLWYRRYHREGDRSFIFGAAVLLGIAALIRPIGLYLIFVFPLYAAAYEIMKRRNALRALVTAGIAVIIGVAVISPWLARNYRVFGIAKLSSIDATNLLFWQGGSVLAVANGTTIDIEKRNLLDMMAREGIDPKNPASGSIFFKKTVQIITAHPWAALKLNALTAWQFFTHDAYYDLAVHLGFYQGRTGPPITILHLRDSLLRIPKLFIEDPAFIFFVAGRGMWIIICILFFCGVWRSFLNPANRERDAFALIIIAHFLLTTLSTGLGVTA